VSRLEGATPAKVAGLSNVTQLSVGPNFGTCARTADGAVYCWGRNDWGQLGRPFPKLLTDTDEKEDARLTVPTRIEGLPPVDEIALGAKVGCAIGSTDRAVYCWGYSPDRARLGIPTTSTVIFAPQRVTTFNAPAKAVRIGTIAMSIVSGADTIMALLEGDVLATTGNQGINGDSLYSTTAPSVRFGIRRIDTFAYASSDDVFRRWKPTEETLYLPTRAPVIEVKISNEFDADNSWQGGALTTTGRLFRWGPNPGGALGQHPNELPGTPYPVEIEQVRDQVVSFATTLESTCASLVDGKIKCWGANVDGELGRGTVDLDAHPEPELIR